MIDWNRAAQLQGEVGAEDFLEVVELFIEEVEDIIDALGDPARSLEHDLHFLKGSALNLGFTAFSELCRKGEAAAASGAGNIVDTAEVIRIYQQSKATFMNNMQDNLSA